MKRVIVSFVSLVLVLGACLMVKHENERLRYQVSMQAWKESKLADTRTVARVLVDWLEQRHGIDGVYPSAIDIRLFHQQHPEVTTDVLIVTGPMSHFHGPPQINTGAPYVVYDPRGYPSLRNRPVVVALDYRDHAILRQYALRLNR